MWKSVKPFQISPLKLQLCSTTESLSKLIFFCYNLQLKYINHKKKDNFLLSYYHQNRMQMPNPLYLSKKVEKEIALSFCQGLLRLEQFGTKPSITLIRPMKTILFPMQGLMGLQQQAHHGIKSQLAAYIKNEKLKNISIMGHGMGGNLTHDLVAEFPLVSIHLF